MGSTSLAAGMVKLGLAGVLPVLLVWTVLHLDRIGRGTVAVLRRCRLLPPPKPDPEPARRPLEDIAADLRRLGTALRDVPRGTSWARHLGVKLAYDDALGAAAQALDVPHALADLPLGLDRDLERLRVEDALRAAGLRFAPRKRQDTP
jgi:hypothetical protein